MKKILFMLMLTLSIGMVTRAQDDKTKVKKTSTLPQKAHNVVSKNNKYKGYKTKKKHNGHVRKRKVDLKHDEVKTKSK